jgi:exosortase E/protease (VPEID-CTERM system)
LNPPSHLLSRLYLFAAVLTVDSLVVAVIPHSVPPLGPLATFGIVSYAVFLGLGYSRLKADRGAQPFRAWLLVAHFVCLLAACVENLPALSGNGAVLDSFAGHLVVHATLLSGIALLALACLPLNAWLSMLRVTSPLWLYASLAGALVWGLRYPSQALWDSSSTGVIGALQTLTFRSVYSVLRLLLPDLIVDPATFTLGTPRFLVYIAKECSGMEGLGLVLVFTTVWLAYFRKESRFPNALLLVPCALVAVWLLNVVRIISLILIGNAGAPDVAMVGFHSQAGWIAFTAVAFAFSMATRKISWVRRVPDSGAGSASAAAMGKGGAVTENERELTGESPATGAYLIPFLAILAASFVSKAASGYFEWLYPLRFVAAAIAIWFSRGELRKLNWRFGWLAPCTGTCVFLVWIGWAWWSKSSSDSSLGASLAALAPLSRFTWIAFRVAAATVTVPIAEELAFRGYLARRLINREFADVPFSSLTLVSIGISSLVFGLFHGHQWMVGLLAGLAYAAVLKWRGRIGDAVVAHATSNLLLAAWVLLRGDWAQW